MFTIIFETFLKGMSATLITDLFLIVLFFIFFYLDVVEKFR